jgi:hypothetical protein
LIVLALCALLALPALALGSDLFDETEPDATVTHVKVNDHKGVAKVFFEGSDPVDAPEDLSYDCELDGGDEGNADDDLDDESGDEGSADDEPGDELDEDSRHDGGDDGVSEVDCDSPWVVKGVDPGKHTVEVVAWDEEWNEDSTPATAQFKVKKNK